MALISQKDHFNANFGDVLRSSAIFWVQNDDSVKTTISFSDYWRYKNDNHVTIVANLRDMNGALIGRQRVAFDKGKVCNFVPPNPFYGSVEVEAFSLKNMRIPYAAVMGIYESADSVSMVHSYARAYSQHEIEERRMICDGEESCWTVREEAGVTSFGVIHNGSAAVPRQTVSLRIRNHRGREVERRFELGPLAPYETVMIEPGRLIDGLEQWLDGRPGNARISFKLGHGFTRMLRGVSSRDKRQLQVTHTDFDYSTHGTDTVAGSALMVVPHLPGEVEVVVYPDCVAGSYEASYDAETFAFKTGDMLRMRLPQTPKNIIFRRTDGPLPSRIITGISVHPSSRVLPAECSLGVVHAEVPKKNFHWMVCREESLVLRSTFDELYGACPDDTECAFKLYSSSEREPLSRGMRSGELRQRGDCLALADIFPNAGEYLGGTFGYLTMWSAHSRLMMFSTLQKNESMTLEHSF